MEHFARLNGRIFRYAVALYIGLSATVMEHKIAYFAYPQKFGDPNASPLPHINYGDLTGKDVIDFVNPIRNRKIDGPNEFGQFRYFKLKVCIQLTISDAKYGAYKGKIETLK